VKTVVFAGVAAGEVAAAAAGVGVDDRVGGEDEFREGSEAAGWLVVSVALVGGPESGLAGAWGVVLAEGAASGVVRLSEVLVGVELTACTRKIMSKAKNLTACVAAKRMPNIANRKYTALSDLG
jgi:hypothetical protein